MEAASEVWFWIDAICINQDDTTERAHQVRLMAGIYRTAFDVLVWLGPAYENSDIAMAELESHQGDWRAVRKATWTLALGGLCSRSYWRRLWVLQELKLAKEKRIMCGTKIIAWKSF